MRNYFNRNKKDIEIKVEDKFNTIAHLGGTMVVDKDFDIKKYLSSIERFKVNNNSKKYNILNSFTTFNSNAYPKNYLYKGYFTAFNNDLTSTKKFKKSGTSFSTDLTKKKYLNTDNSTYLDYNNKTNTNYNFLSTKNSSKLLSNRKNNFSKYTNTMSNEFFNVYKAVKEIKKSTQFPKINNIKKSPNKKLFKAKVLNNKDKKKSPIAYSKEYVDIVFDSKKLINNYNFRKGLDLDPPEDLVTFSTEKKEISFKNVLIDLLNNESEKLSIKEKKFNIRNEKNKNSIDNAIKEFEDFTDKHKQLCKKIENCFDRLQKENNVLLNELIIYKSIHKSYVDEIQKLLEQIENLRIYALFVHQSLEKDISRYEKNIFPDYRKEKLGDYNLKIEKIRNFVINNYSIFWDSKYREELKDELELLEDPEIMSQKFYEIERNIMRLLDVKDELDQEIEEDEKSHKIILDELKSKYAKAEKEYKKLDKNLNFEMNQINNLKKKEVDHNSEYIALIGTLFLNIVEIFGENDKFKMNYKAILNRKIGKENIDICIKESERILRENEDLLNNSLHAIKSYQEKDGKFFNQIMEEIKQKNKAQKFLLYKKNKMDKQYENEAKFIHKANKINIISRKTEAPYHSPQKKTKKIINHELIKRLENEELLKYQ